MLCWSPIWTWVTNLVENESKQKDINRYNKQQPQLNNMDFFKQVITNPMFWGFLIGFIFFAIAWWSWLKTKLELRRLRIHLTDKLELEADKLSHMKGEIEGLKGENENLRMKINAGRTMGNQEEAERNLEIYARAEKIMMVNAPGFAPAWETAKENAITEIEAEEQGKNAPKKIFKKLFKGGASSNREVVDVLPEKAATTTQSADSSSS